MRRALVVSMFLFGALSCQLPPEQMPLKPLPDDSSAWTAKSSGCVTTLAMMRATTTVSKRKQSHMVE